MVWQVKGRTSLDYLVIADDDAEADKIVEKWKELNFKEKELKEAAGKETEERGKLMNITF